MSTADVTRRGAPPLLGAAAALITTLVMFGDVLLAGRGRVLSSAEQDLASIFYYWDRFAFGELARGNLVLWNPYSFAGAPFLGGFQPALLYPPNWLHLVLPTALAINVGVAFHFFLAGFGVYLWTAHRGLHSAACVFAAVVFMCCGAHVLQLYAGHVPHLCTLAWTPLVFLAIDRVVESRSLEWVLLGMAVVAMQILAGNVQYVHYTAMFAALYACMLLVGAARRARTAGALVAMAVGGGCLAAIQLLTAVDAVRESLRAALSYGIAASFPLPPENLLTLVFPGLFGDMITVPYWGRQVLHESSLFVGAGAFLLALAGAVHGAPRVHRFSVVMALVALVMAFGDYTPLFRVLYDVVPGFHSVRAIARLGFVVSLFIAMLAAIGLDHLLRQRHAPRWLATVALALGGLASAVGLAVAADCRSGGTTLWLPALRACRFLADAYQLFIVERAPEAAAACANAGASLLVGGATFVVIGLLLLASQRTPRAVYAVALIGIIELVTYARFTRATFDPAPLASRSDALRRLAAERALGDARVASEVPHFYLALSAGVPDVWGGADLVLGRYARFVAAAEHWPVEAILVAPGIRELSPMLGMLRLGHLLRVDRENHVILTPTNLRTLPRAALLSRWNVLASPEAVLTALGDSGFDPERAVLLESDPGLATDPGNETGTVTVTDVSTDELEVRAEVRRPAVLLMNDNYSAGWKATAFPDSSARSYRVMPGDYTLRAIPLPVGTHHFRLEYRPIGFVIGRWVTIAASIAWLAAAVGYRRRRRGSTDSPGRDSR